jgi:hypothetical protein
MAAYLCDGLVVTNTTTYKSGGLVYASTTNGSSLRRGKLYEFLMGASSLPNATDCAIEYDITRITATTTIAGTSTVIPNVLDLADLATPAAAAFITLTAEPTALGTGPVFSVALNQRNSQRWQVVDESQMIVWPASQGAGVTARSLSTTYAGATITAFTFRE